MRSAFIVVKLSDLKAMEGPVWLIAVSGVALGLIAILLYVAWIPGFWIPPGDRIWPWLTPAVGSLIYFLAVIVRLCRGEKWR